MSSPQDIQPKTTWGTSIPRNRKDDYSENAAARRRSFIRDVTGSPTSNLGTYGFDPDEMSGNVEHFFGVAQVPLGLAGPLVIDGEYAQGEFYVPLATTEGTLVASYNRGMKILAHSGGAKTTIQADGMQRAPGFIFRDARSARDFTDWVETNMTEISAAAESTTRIGKLLGIMPFLSNKFAYLRFTFSTGDAAGQNMVNRATDAACQWIRNAYPDADKIENFYLAGNMSTDKKPSFINQLHSRGKRVTVEAVLKRDVLRKFARTTPESIVTHNRLGDIGTMISGSMSNGCHGANGITALFIATGQDVATVSECTGGINYSEVTPEGDLYASVTLPSLAVATHGGGTGLPTQRECLKMLGCTGAGSVYKFTEIVAATVMAGEISLAAAVSSNDWVNSHEQYGRNR